MTVENTDTSVSEDNSSDENINLEDMEVTEEELKEIEDPQEDQETESESEIEEDKTEVTESEEESQDESEETEDKTEEVELSPEEQQKAHNKEMAEKRIAEKRQRDELIRQQQQTYIEETEDPLEAATRQNQVELYNIKVENLTNKLTNSYERAIKDFEILNDQTPEVKEMVSEAIDTFQALYVPIDAYGNPKEIKADFYQYLQNKASSIEKLTQIGARKQVDNKAAEKSKTITPPSRTPKPKKSDPDLEAFYEEAYK